MKFSDHAHESINLVKQPLTPTPNTALNYQKPTDMIYKQGNCVWRSDDVELLHIKLAPLHHPP